MEEQGFTSIEEIIEAEQDETVITAANTMLGDLMAIVVELAKALPCPWQELSQQEQESWLENVDGQCEKAIRDCVRIIAAKGATVVPATVEQVVFKDGCKVQMKLLSMTEGAHAIADEVGSVVAITISDADELTSDNEKPGADPDQMDIESTPSEHYDEAVEFVRETGRASISSIQRKFRIGYNAAARIIERMEEEGVVTEMGDNGKRQVIDQEDAA